MSKFENRFSIAHPDKHCIGSMFYDAFARADEKFRSEVADVYFGSNFEYEFKGEKKVYSNSMGVGVDVDSEEFEWLMKAQKDFGVSVSLTINPTYHPWEMMFHKETIDSFIEWLKKFYDAGVRVCTISNITLMRTRVLQNHFPEMKWKNTVNHKVKTAQEFLDFAKLGYDHIQVDRSLNRNLDELKNIRKIADRLDKKVYMLVHEDCMPECPMFSEHTQTLSTARPYDVKDACGRWTFRNVRVPRINLDAYWMYSKTFDLYEPLVDVFKYSGRFASISKNSKFEWFFGDRSDFPPEDANLDIRRPNFEVIHNNGNGSYLSWFLPMPENPIGQRAEPLTDDLKIELHSDLIDEETVQNINKLIDNLIPVVEIDEPEEIHDIPLTVWDSKQGRALEKKLTNCRSQCYDCHLCEITFGIEPFDSVIDITEEYKDKQEPLVSNRVKEIMATMPAVPEEDNILVNETP